MRILFTGPVGSGKSTQAEKLAAKLNIPLFQSGAITRKIAQEQTPLGERVKGMMEKGELIDDQTIVEAIKAEMSRVDTSRGFIFDGFPRTLEQVRLFDPGFDIVFDFKISDQEATNRLLKRQRKDDTPEAIQKRLDIYYQQTRPMIEHYQNLGILKEINAEDLVEAIFEQIRALAEER